MGTADTGVPARIDTHTKEHAAEALEAMGLSTSDATRLPMRRQLPSGHLVVQGRIQGRIEDLIDRGGDKAAAAGRSLETTGRWIGARPFLFAFPFYFPCLAATGVSTGGFQSLPGIEAINRRV